MPAKSINLITRRDFDNTAIGKFLRWSLTYGRYIIISTEIIVLLAFILRFSLDRTITDLNEEIDQKAAIVKANIGFEDSFRNLQKRTLEINTLFQNHDLLTAVVTHLQKITPPEIRFTSMTFEPDSISITATATTTTGLGLFLDQLKTSTLLTDIKVLSLNKKSVDSGETLFRVEARLVIPTSTNSENSL